MGDGVGGAVLGDAVAVARRTAHAPHLHVAPSRRRWSAAHSSSHGAGDTALGPPPAEDGRGEHALDHGPVVVETEHRHVPGSAAGLLLLLLLLRAHGGPEIAAAARQHHVRCHVGRRVLSCYGQLCRRPTDSHGPCQLTLRDQRVGRVIAGHKAHVRIKHVRHQLVGALHGGKQVLAERVGGYVARVGAGGDGV